MLRPCAILICLWLCLPARAAEKVFDFSKQKLNEMPEGFRSTLTGFGKAGEWKTEMLTI